MASRQNYHTFRRREMSLSSHKSRLSKQEVSMNKLLPALFVLARVLTVAILCFAISSGTAAAGGEVPFKGRLEGAFTITPIDATFFAVLTKGAGNATHLGQFTLEMPHIVNSVIALRSDRFPSQQLIATG
jgi:hypothetical protein